MVIYHTAASNKVWHRTACRYGSRLHFWDWKGRKLVKSLDLGPAGCVPLEVRMLHNPAASHGFMGAAVGSTIWHIHDQPVLSAGTTDVSSGSSGGGQPVHWTADPVITIPPVTPPAQPAADTSGAAMTTAPAEPVPAIISDILISMDDRYLYFSTWLHVSILYVIC